MTERLHNFAGPAWLRLFMKKAPVVERVFDMDEVPERATEAQCYPWDEAEYKVGPDAKGRFWWLTIEGKFVQVAPYCNIEQSAGWYAEFEMDRAFLNEIMDRYDAAPWVKLAPPLEWIQ